MAQNRSDNIRVLAPKPIDDKWGVFDSGLWRPFNDLAEFDSLQPSVIQYETQMFWVRSTTDANKADLYALRKDKSKYKIISDIDVSLLQPKTDEALDTEDKTIVGAINEINSNLVDIINIGYADLEADHKTYVNTSLAEKTFQLFQNGINRFLTSDEFTIDPDGGFVLLYELSNGDSLFLMGQIGGASSEALELAGVALSLASIPTSTASLEQQLSDLSAYTASYWKGKTVLVLGTSIPEQAKYFDVAIAKLGGTCINNCKGSSPIRIAKADGTINGLNWQTVAFALAHTTAEKQNLITNWATISLVLTGSDKPTNLSAEDQALILSCSYQVRLTPYLNGTNPTPDLIIISHGYNDNFSTDTDTDYTTVPSTRDNRNYFLGAYNYILDHIYSFSPRQRIMIDGHYENTKVGNIRISQAQLNMAAIGELPIMKSWEETGWSQYVAPGSQPLWATLPYSLYAAAAGPLASEDMTQQRLANPDGVHPHTDSTGRSQALLARIAFNKLINLS